MPFFIALKFGGDEITYEWDFDYDGSFDPSDWTKGDAIHTYPESGNYIVRLQITDTGVGGSLTGMCSEEVAGIPSSYLERGYTFLGLFLNF